MRSLLVASACLLSACGGSASVEAIAPPASLIAPCAAPVALPAAGLDDQQIEILWGRDRSALRQCGDRHAALSTWHSGDLP